MFCPYCGTQVADNSSFCNHCGMGLEPTEPVTRTQTPVEPTPVDPYSYNPTPVSPYATYEQAQTNTYVNEDEKRAEAKKIMILAIIGAALGEFGLPGLIVTLIAKKRLNKYLEKYGQLQGMAIAARWISLAGLIFSIIMTVFWTYYFFMIFMFIAAEFGSSFY